MWLFWLTGSHFMLTKSCSSQLPTGINILSLLFLSMISLIKKKNSDSSNVILFCYVWTETNTAFRKNLYILFCVICFLKIQNSSSKQTLWRKYMHWNQQRQISYISGNENTYYNGFVPTELVKCIHFELSLIQIIHVALIYTVHKCCITGLNRHIL